MSRPFYRFGSFELDAANCELRRDGALVKLAPQPLKILPALVSRPGQLFTRDERYSRVLERVGLDAPAKKT